MSKNSRKAIKTAKKFGNRFNDLVALATASDGPRLAIDIVRVKQAYDDLRNFMPDATIYYAVKACPEVEVLKSLLNKGSKFDAASWGEIELLLSLGVKGEDISFGNTTKDPDEIALAYKNGVRIYTTDSYEDLQFLSENAPGSKIVIRILVDCKDAAIDLGEKFGANPDMAYDLAIEAKELGLIPYGLAFHVGSQQEEISQFANAFTNVSSVYYRLADDAGLKIKCINIGGGIPADYEMKTESVRTYCDSIMELLDKHFDINNIEVMMEPGRCIVANAGIIGAKVIRLSKKWEHDTYHYLFLNVGFYNGWNEMAYIQSLLYYPGDKSDRRVKATICGPTCCGYDITPTKFNYSVPHDLKYGDKVIILTTGAYTSSLSTINFNHVKPLEVVVLPE